MNKQVTITHLIDHLGAGGAQEIIKNLVSGLDQSQFRHEIISFFDDDLYSEDLEKLGAKIYKLHWGKYSYARVLLNLANPMRYLRLYRMLKEKDRTILHVHLFFSYIMCGILGTVFNGKRMVYTMHAMRNQVPFFFRLMPFFARSYDAIIADAEEAANEIKKVIPDHDKISFITIGTNYFELPYDRSFHVAGISDTDPVVLSVGRLHRQKNHYDLISAFSEVAAEIPEAKLVIVGEGEEFEKLHKQVKELSLTKSVFFLKYQGDRLKFYDRCTVFAHPSLREAIGIAVLEAMSRKKPIVAFDIGSLKSVIQNNANGFLVPPNDVHAYARALISILKNVQLQKTIGAAAADFIRQHYSLRNLVDQYGAVYKSLS